MMVILVSGARRSPEEHRQFRVWCNRNGILASEVVGPLRVDPASGTVAYDRMVGEPGPGDSDFPEFRRDSLDNPVVEEWVVPLNVEPPGWLRVDETDPKVA